jgi:hypothetical protein
VSYKSNFCICSSSYGCNYIFQFGLYSRNCLAHSNRVVAVVVVALSDDEMVALYCFLIVVRERTMMTAAVVSDTVRSSKESLLHDFLSSRLNIYFYFYCSVMYSGSGRTAETICCVFCFSSCCSNNSAQISFLIQRRSQETRYRYDVLISRN